jgi:hypothetical protein
MKVQIRPSIPAMMLLLGLSFGCAESTWVWSLNPDGSGKVALEAEIIPPLARMHYPSEKVARLVESHIMRNSRGIAGWKDVRSGVTREGRVEFVGTAYFRDLSKVRIKGEVPLTLVSPPVMRTLDDGRIEVTLAIGNEGDVAGETDTDDKLEDDDMPEGESTEFVLKRRMQWQTARPLVDGILSTMKTTAIVKMSLPSHQIAPTAGANREVLKLEVDGEELVALIDKAITGDPSLPSEFQSVIDSRKMPTRAALKKVFGAASYKRASFDPPMNPVFDFETELASALPTPPEWDDGSETWGGVSVGVVASERTGSGTGIGGSVRIAGRPDTIDPAIRGLFFCLDIAQIKYEDDATHPTQEHWAFGIGVSKPRWRTIGALLLTTGTDSALVGEGLQFFLEFGRFGRGAELYLAASCSALRRGDESKTDVQGDLRLMGGFRF